ncbi:hypothetical protein Pmani_018549 [Petrolisthes manimaculis]|uniref:Uncharacterized protein n=1 Tax=Petrolisthes manimaculis TaxID=1843537 RepID=A0AAE1U4F4_9EUCA|nr:hypothetical protein Pmani_018549 [Petrolisthes manimaculis]
MSFLKTPDIVCGERPQLNLLMPLYTKAKFQNYNNCLAEQLARPHIMTEAVSLLTPVASILTIVFALFWWWKNRQGLKVQNAEIRYHGSMMQFWTKVWNKSVMSLKPRGNEQVAEPDNWNKVWLSQPKKIRYEEALCEETSPQVYHKVWQNSSEEVCQEEAARCEEASSEETSPQIFKKVWQNSSEEVCQEEEARCEEARSEETSPQTFQEARSEVTSPQIYQKVWQNNSEEVCQEEEARCEEARSEVTSPQVYHKVWQNSSEEVCQEEEARCEEARSEETSPQTFQEARSEVTSPQVYHKVWRNSSEEVCQEEEARFEETSPQTFQEARSEEEEARCEEARSEVTSPQTFQKARSEEARCEEASPLTWNKVWPNSSSSIGQVNQEEAARLEVMAQRPIPFQTWTKVWQGTSPIAPLNHLPMTLDNLHYESGNAVEAAELLVDLELEIDKCKCGGECVLQNKDLIHYHKLLLKNLPSSYRHLSDGKERIKVVTRDITKKFFSDMGMEFLK